MAGPIIKQLSGDALRFLEPPSLKHNVDGSLELLAHFVCPLHPEVIWRFGDAPIGTEENRSLHYYVTFIRMPDETCRSILRISDASDGDAGLYKCDIATETEAATALVEVPNDLFKRPCFVQKTGFHTRDNGRLVVMDFRVRSSSTLKAAWTQDGEPLPDGNSVNVVWRKESSDTYYGALILCLHPNYHERVYECRLVNDFGELLASFSGSEQSLRSGGPRLMRPLSGRHMVKDRVHLALFDVGFQSSSTPFVTWWNPKGKKLEASGRIKVSLQRDGGSETGDVYTARMQMANWGERDAGRYTCTIENERGRTAADVYFRDVDHVGKLMSRLFSYDHSVERRGSSPY